MVRTLNKGLAVMVAQAPSQFAVCVSWRLYSTQKKKVEKQTARRWPVSDAWPPLGGVLSDSFRPRWSSTDSTGIGRDFFGIRGLIPRMWRSQRIESGDHTEWTDPRNRQQKDGEKKELICLMGNEVKHAPMVPFMLPSCSLRMIWKLFSIW